MSQCKLPELCSTVQKNCHIADAMHAGSYTLCIYLLKMREFYRWEHHRSFADNLDQATIGDWLRQREQLWEELEDREFEPIRLAGRQFDAFDADAINPLIAADGLIYSAGIGILGRPHFFLGQRHDTYQHDDYTVYISSREYARDLSAPPAMSQNRTIFIRRESLQRMLWEKLEEWRWNRPDNAMARVVEHYEFDADLNRALDSMTDNELNSILLHEIGEVEAGKFLGEDWQAMLMELPHSKAELMLRALRDHIADALSTLPALLEEENSPALHFYMANLSSMRKHLYPALQNAYRQWLENASLAPLKQQVEQGRQHWQALAEQSLELYRQQGAEACPAIETLLEKSIL